MSASASSSRASARAAHFFRARSLSGFADDGAIWINVVLEGADLVDTVAHEVAHIAGYDEREAQAVSGLVRYRDGGGEALDAAALIAAPEAALRLLWIAVLALGIGALLARYAS